MKLLFGLIVLLSCLAFSTFDELRNDFENTILHLDKHRNTSIVVKIEQRLNMSLNEIKNVLVNGQESEKFKLLLPMVLEVIDSKRRIEKFVNEIIIPSCVCHRFRLAWGIMKEVMSTCQSKNIQFYKDRLNVSSLGLPREIEEKLIQKKNILNDEFILIIETQAPALNKTFIQKIAENSMESYYHSKKKRRRYQDEIVFDFLAWKKYLQEDNGELKRQIFAEFIKKYGNDFKDHVERFCLIQARNFYLCHHIEKFFWEEFQKRLGRGIIRYFEDVLDREYIDWYFTVEHLNCFNLLVRAVNTVNKSNIREMEFEKFSARPEAEVVLPQFPMISKTNRNVQYFMQRWPTSNLSFKLK